MHEMIYIGLYCGIFITVRKCSCSSIVRAQLNSQGCTPNCTGRERDFYYHQIHAENDLNPKIRERERERARSHNHIITTRYKFRNILRNLSKMLTCRNSQRHRAGNILEVSLRAVALTSLNTCQRSLLSSPTPLSFHFINSLTARGVNGAGIEWTDNYQCAEQKHAQSALKARL